MTEGMPGTAVGGAGGAGTAHAAAPQPSAASGWWGHFKAAVKRLKREVLALHYAMQDPRVGLLPRLLGLLAVAYALSPLDVVPDFIPVLGLVDDLLILPGLILLARWLIPTEVMREAQERAEREPLRLQKSWGMALFVFLLWDALALSLAWWACARFGGNGPVQQHKVWIVAGSGAVLVAAELAWAVAQWRKESRQRRALHAAGTQPEMQEALLEEGSAAVQEYLEP